MMTVEYLRKRLLAERIASKLAKEDAELMGEKLIVLEAELKKEMESKKKAEKKLRFLTKKLHSLKSTSFSGQSSLSQKKDLSSPTNSQTKSCSTEEIGEMAELIVLESVKANAKANHSETVNGSSIHQITFLCTEESSNSGGGTGTCADIGVDPSEDKLDELKDSHSSGMSASDILQQQSEGGKDFRQEQDKREDEDNSQALVPVQKQIECVENLQGSHYASMMFNSKAYRGQKNP